MLQWKRALKSQIVCFVLRGHVFPLALAFACPPARSASPHPPPFGPPQWPALRAGFHVLQTHVGPRETSKEMTLAGSMGPMPLIPWVQGSHFETPVGPMGHWSHWSHGLRVRVFVTPAGPMGPNSRSGRLCPTICGFFALQ